MFYCAKHFNAWRLVQSLLLKNDFNFPDFREQSHTAVEDRSKYLIISDVSYIVIRARYIFKYYFSGQSGPSYTLQEVLLLKDADIARSKFCQFLSGWSPSSNDSKHSPAGIWLDYSPFSNFACAT